MDYKSQIVKVDDWPALGITYFDISPLLVDGSTFKDLIDQLVEPYRGMKIDAVVGIEARGLVLAGAMADRLGCGMVAIRKKGKTAGKVISQEYNYEYSSAVVEIQQDLLSSGDKVILVDDILATGGTMAACAKLMEKIQVDVLGISFVVEKTFLSGRDRFENIPTYSLFTFE